MDTLKPDFSIIERTWLARLRERGLSPSAIGEGIATGYDRLELYRQETQVAEYKIDEPLGIGYLASMEVKVAVGPPSLGEYEVLDLVTQRGTSLEDALATCANTFMDVTFPPLATLFNEERPTGLGTGSVKLSSYTPALDRAIKWDVVLGRLQIVNDRDGKIEERLRAQPPVALMLNTLTGYLCEPRLHWCKLYGTNTAKAGIVFGCAIDGQKSAEGEAEMAEGFGEPVPGDWEFRQFMAVRPIGDADAETTAKLRASYAEAFPEKKSWWSRLLGR